MTAAQQVTSSRKRHIARKRKSSRRSERQGIYIYMHASICTEKERQRETRRWVQKKRQKERADREREREKGGGLDWSAAECIMYLQ